MPHEPNPPSTRAPDAQRRLRRQLEGLCYDDCLTFHEYRVEYLQLGEQKPHYRVFHGPQLVGIVHVGSRRFLPTIHNGLARWLIAQAGPEGEAHIQQYGAQTVGAPRKTGVPRLSIASR